MPAAPPHALYDDKPGLKAFVETPNLSGYTEQNGEYGTRPGTILPHHNARISLERLGKQRHDNIPIGVMMIEEPSKTNPFGGIKMLTPLIDSSKITPEMQEAARKKAEAMSDNPVQRGLAMYDLLARQANGETIEASPSAPPASTAAPQVPAAPSPVSPTAANPLAAIDQNALMQLLLGQLLQNQAPPAPAPPPFVPPPAAAPAPVYLPPQPTALPPLPPSLVPEPERQLNPLETLGIPNLLMEPQRPAATVVFDLGELGQQSAFFHWVVLEGKGLYLVFDGRYDYPCWTPPDLGPNRPLTVRLENAAGGPKTLRCLSVGFNFRFGVFRFACLIVVE